MKMYKLMKRSEHESSYQTVETLTEDELKGVISKVMRFAIVVNDNHKGNPIMMFNLHSPEVSSIPDEKIFITFEEVEV